jgi:hypothetical protein
MPLHELFVVQCRNCNGDIVFEQVPGKSAEGALTLRAMNLQCPNPSCGGAHVYRPDEFVPCVLASSTNVRLVWIAPLNPKRRMRSRWRLVLRIRLTITSEASRGGHALLEGRETAICPAVVEAAVNRTPRIILGFGAHSDSDDADTNPQDE